jgi:hypothetical protein
MVGFLIIVLLMGSAISIICCGKQTHDLTPDPDDELPGVDVGIDFNAE